MDVKLVDELARARPDVHFVLIGPVVKIDPAELPRYPNIHWLGGRDYKQLPDYMSGWDAAFMPFALNESTRFISPTKTPEFLAAGLPVCSTPITDVVSPYGDLGLVAIGITFAYLLYVKGSLSAEDAREQFPGVYTFLGNKWCFDDLYSVALVRPALVVAHWFKAFDLGAIDGVLHAVARGAVRLSKWNGRFDNGVIDGLANLTADTFQGFGGWLRNVQTGYLRSYVLFLVLAAVGLFLLLTYFVTMVTAG